MRDFAPGGNAGDERNDIFVTKHARRRRRLDAQIQESDHWRQRTSLGRTGARRMALDICSLESAIARLEEGLARYRKNLSELLRGASEEP